MKTAWTNKDELPISFPLMGINGSILDLGGNYKCLRKNDMLFAPRIHQWFLIIQTPSSAGVAVLSDWCGSSYVSLRAVAIYFGVGIPTVKRWCRMGVIPADKNKNRWQVLRMLIGDEIPELIVGDSLLLIAQLGVN